MDSDDFEACSRDLVEMTEAIDCILHELPEVKNGDLARVGECLGNIHRRVNMDDAGQ